MRAAHLALALLTLLLGGLAFAAPAGHGNKPRAPRDDKPKGAEVTKQGKIRIVRGLSGAEPQLTDEAGTRYLCTGGPREELLRLDGHQVKAVGSVGPKKLMVPTFKVVHYELLGTGGRRPLTGVLRHEPKHGYRLERADGPLEIVASKGFRRQLARRVGCKIWIVGEIQGPSIKASKFGWLSCAPARIIKPQKENSK